MPFYSHKAADNASSAASFFFMVYSTARTLPIVLAASFCALVVTWAQVSRMKPALDVYRRMLKKSSVGAFV